MYGKLKHQYIQPFFNFEVILITLEQDHLNNFQQQTNIKDETVLW